MARVPPSTFGKCKGIHPINLFPDQSRISEFPLSHFPCRRWVESALDVLFCGDLQVEVELFALLGIGFLTLEEAPPTHPCFSGMGFRMRLIALTSCSQRDVCAASCLFPSGVSR